MQTMIGIWAVEFYALFFKPKVRNQYILSSQECMISLLQATSHLNGDKKRESHHPTGSISPQSFTACFCSSVGNFANTSLSLSIGAVINPANVSKGGLSGAPG